MMIVRSITMTLMFIKKVGVAQWLDLPLKVGNSNFELFCHLHLHPI